jgi:hypothetical protein
VSVRFYMDVHVDVRVTRLLRQRGVDVITAQEDGAAEMPDGDLLDRATALRRVLVTEDKDFLYEAAARQRGGMAFDGIVFAHGRDLSVLASADDLTLLAEAEQPEAFANQVRFLPI